MRLAHKRARRKLVAFRCWRADAWLALGRPAALAGHLRAQQLRPKVVRHKQGILYLTAGERFLRYASRPRAVARLRRELAGWEHLKAHGLAPILPLTLRLEALGPGVLLDSERLRPITLDQQLAATVTIIAALAGAARPIAAAALPATLEAGLALARSVAGGSLPAIFADEAEIRAAFAGPLRTGPSHQDLQLSNVMQDGAGRPVLIDLKSYAESKVLALDVLNFVCKYRAAREGSNVVDQAFAAQGRGWQLAELSPALAFVDLPRPLWGPILALYSIGRVASKAGGAGRPNALVRRALRKLLTRDWRSGAPARALGSGRPSGAVGRAA